ncbi:unnamed protein product [Phytomonas sp. Hart1]|nr:unnamed protein product [Phytomonas sp. Hart1]|eukprot:CCW70981.1 unnamed protein product [Phytomonas sp. isolate Hart1]
MSTAAVDGRVVLWDVEAGVCQGVLTNPTALPALQHCHHPSHPAHLLVALDRKVALYDVRASFSRVQREYTGHRSAILHLGLLRDPGKLLTTSEDKTLRTWDFRVAVQIRQFADAGMHAITHVVAHPQQPELLAAQSLDNKVLLFKDLGGGRLSQLRQREFTGHNISGTRCQLGFSRDGRYLSSGDLEGNLFVWDWANGRLVKSFKAHAQMLVSHAWHPLESSRVVTAAWDGCIKNWV